MSELTNYLQKRPTARNSKRELSEASFGQATNQWYSESPVEQRKSLGQYMTPKAIREILLDCVNTSVDSVLDPGVGTGEFLSSFRERNSSARMVGWDIDPAIAEVARRTAPNAEILVRDALSETPSEEFDLVIGNPPYFQFAGAEAVRHRFSNVISGRPNIFALFFQVGLESLRQGGQLAYVVPTSMNSGAYFRALRHYILDSGSIERIIPVQGTDAFADAQTSVQIIVIRKGATGDDYVFTRSLPGGRKRVIFSDNPKQLINMFAGRKTLYELGYTAITGQVVWNQAKERLRENRDDSSTVRLVWARDIGDGVLLPPTPDVAKHPYVLAGEALVGPAIVVNRIVGAVGKAHIRAAIVPERMRFLGENHVNVIVPHNHHEPSVTYAELCDLLLASDTAERLSRLTGNTQVSATELTHLLPLG